MTIQDRLKECFDPSRHSQAALARAARVKQASVSDWFTGKTKSLMADPLVRAALYLDVSPAWLAIGQGPMRDPAQRPSWPFAAIDEAELCRLPPDDLARVEAALVATVQILGLSVGNRRAA